MEEERRYATAAGSENLGVAAGDRYAPRNPPSDLHSCGIFRRLSCAQRGCGGGRGGTMEAAEAGCWWNGGLLAESCGVAGAGVNTREGSPLRCLEDPPTSSISLRYLTATDFPEISPSLPSGASASSLRSSSSQATATATVARSRAPDA